MVALASTVFFVAADGVHSRELWAWQPDACEGPVIFHRRDSNVSSVSDTSDAIAIFGFLFLADATPTCVESADVNNDDSIDISDRIAILNWLFIGGSEPAPPGSPGGPCGFDPDPVGSPGDLGCEDLDNCI